MATMQVQFCHRFHLPFVNSPRSSSSIYGRSTEFSKPIPTMSEMIDFSRARSLDLRIQTWGPLFRATATNLKTKREVGRGEGMIRVWIEGKILHLDSIRLSKESLDIDRSIFGIGIVLGSLMVRHGYDSGCTRAELLSINDSDLYHSKGSHDIDVDKLIIKVYMPFHIGLGILDPLHNAMNLCQGDYSKVTNAGTIKCINVSWQFQLVRFYRRIGFETVKEVDGSSMADLSHMLVWGGRGTLMEANIEHLLTKWCTLFKTRKEPLIS